MPTVSADVFFKEFYGFCSYTYIYIYTVEYYSAIKKNSFESVQVPILS